MTKLGTLALGYFAYSQFLGEILGCALKVGQTIPGLDADIFSATVGFCPKQESAMYASSMSEEI